MSCVQKKPKRPNHAIWVWKRLDYANIPIQQKGLHAKGFEFMRLSKDVEGLVSNYQRLIDGYLAGRPAADLAKANHELGGNFDGPIKEFGF